MVELTFDQKSLLATLLLALACVQVLLIAMARGKLGTFSPDMRRWLVLGHRFEGYIAFFVALWVAYNCIFNIADKSEAPRVVIHAIMGTVLLGLFMVKIAISRGLRRFYKRLPVLGAVLFVAITVLWVTSAGWYYFAQDAGY